MKMGFLLVHDGSCMNLEIPGTPPNLKQKAGPESPSAKKRLEIGSEFCNGYCPPVMDFVTFERTEIDNSRIEGTLPTRSKVSSTDIHDSEDFEPPASPFAKLLHQYAPFHGRKPSELTTNAIPTRRSVENENEHLPFPSGSSFNQAEFLLSTSSHRIPMFDVAEVDYSVWEEAEDDFARVPSAQQVSDFVHFVAEAASRNKMLSLHSQDISTAASGLKNLVPCARLDYNRTVELD